MPSNVQTVSATPTPFWVDSLIIGFAILCLCFDYVCNGFKQGLTVEGTIQIEHAGSILFGLCLLSLLIVYLL